MKNTKFLLVDDSQSTNFFNRMMLTKALPDHDTQIAENGEEALKLIHGTFRPDIIFLDINMPKMNGWEFLEALQKTNLTPNDTAVILMLGAELPDHKKQEVNKIPYIKGCLPKMLTQDTVLNTVSKLENNELVNTACA